MSNRPPLLPFESLDRVLSIATRDGRMLLIFSGLFAVLSAMFGYPPGAIAGCLAAGAGAIELHGVTLLQRREIQGMTWLVVSQGFLLLVIVAYVIFRIQGYDAVQLSAQITDEVKKTIASANLTEEEFLKSAKYIYYIMYSIVGIGSVLYQGRLAYIFHERKEAVRQALLDESF